MYVFINISVFLGVGGNGQYRWISTYKVKKGELNISILLILYNFYNNSILFWPPAYLTHVTITQVCCSFFQIGSRWFTHPLIPYAVLSYMFLSACEL